MIDFDHGVFEVCITVWRLEDGKGFGPYGRWHVTDILQGCKDNKPMPYNDGIRKIPCSYYFGTLHLKQFFTWFPKRNLRKLEKKYPNEYKVKLYKCDSKYKVKMGHNQVCFNKREAWTIFSLDILHFINNY